MIANGARKHVEEIENKLKNYKEYNQIPQEFINIIDANFEAFSYLKSLLELKKENI